MFFCRPIETEDPANNYAGGLWDSDGVGGPVDVEGLIGNGGIAIVNMCQQLICLE
jgi:hypothetical protein